jgi:hypothetical protein
MWCALGQLTAYMTSHQPLMMETETVSKTLDTYSTFA